MAWTFISVIVLLVFKYIFCGLSVWILLDTIAVILFCLRMVGATFKIKTLAILHGVSLGIWIMWTFMFGNWEGWPQMVIYLVISLLTCGVFVYEDIAYVIVEKDERSTNYDDDD